MPHFKFSSSENAEKSEKMKKKCSEQERSEINEAIDSRKNKLQQGT